MLYISIGYFTIKISDSQTPKREVLYELSASFSMRTAYIISFLRRLFYFYYAPFADTVFLNNPK